MTGEGTGGGGALAVLLALWIVAVAFAAGGDPLRGEPAAADDSAADGDVALAGDPGGTTTLAEPIDTTPPSVPACATDCDEPITRADLAASFAEAFELPVTTNDFFSDDDGHPFEADINRLAAAGITSGCGADEFCPDGLVSRGQMASFLSRVLGLPEADADYFADDEGSSHEAAINRLAAAGLTEGCGPAAFCPDDPVTRGQLVTFLNRALLLDESAA
jgi:hypothetical protein